MNKEEMKKELDDLMFRRITEELSGTEEKRMIQLSEELTKQEQKEIREQRENYGHLNP